MNPEHAPSIDALADAIDRILPQTQCTRCGYPACRPYAEAIAKGEAEINQCPPGGARGIIKLAALMKTAPKPLNPSNGMEGPLKLAFIDEAACIGCTLCIQACPVDAIVGASKQMHTVIAELCTGCDLCVAPCPVDCIAMIPAPESLSDWTDARANDARQRFESRKARLGAQETKRHAKLGKRDAASDTASAIARQELIRAAMERAKAKQGSAVPRNTENLPPEVEKRLRQIDAKRDIAAQSDKEGGQVMNAQKRRQIFEQLRAGNPAPRTELKYRSPFELLVAVVLSAQATDRGVNLATPALFRDAGTPQLMHALGVERLCGYIKSIGLYRSKAKHLIETCRMLVELHDGEVPRDRESLEALPGVGRKTANVVLNTAFGEPTIAVDTHIFRVANRTGIAPGKDVLQVEHRLQKFVADEFKLDAHHWLILHGRYVCKARKPECPGCGIRELCEYRSKTKADAPKPKTPRAL